MAKIFLSAGHGGNDPGAVANGLKEKNVNLQTMLACRDVLLAHGHEVVCSRVTDENDPVQSEVREANASNADVAISFHANAGRGDGFEVFYWPTSLSGKRLALLCEKHVKQMGQNSRGCKTNDLMFTRATTMVAVLVETAFLDHPVDHKTIDTLSEQKAFGVAYAKAILEYLGTPYKGEKTYSVTVKNLNKSKADALVTTLKKQGYKPVIKEI